MPSTRQNGPLTSRSTSVVVVVRRVADVLVAGVARLAVVLPHRRVDERSLVVAAGLGGRALRRHLAVARAAQRAAAERQRQRQPERQRQRGAGRRPGLPRAPHGPSWSVALPRPARCSTAW